MPLFLAFLLVPLIEIALFIQVGGWIGLWPTLAVVVLTAIAGTVLVRSQGSAVLSQLKGALDDFRDPTEPLAHGAMILFSGALLLTPGFFTDAVGFLLLIPGVRLWVMRQVRARIKVQTFTSRGSATFRRPDARAGDKRARDDMHPGGEVIDGDYEEITPTHNPERGPSGWTRH